MPPTANYLAAAAQAYRRPQWLVEIDLDRCDNEYADNTPPSTCEASDGGDGSRCYYTFGTCQDPTNFRADTLGTKTWRFCLREVPWTDTAYAVFPLLRAVIPVPQQVDWDRLFTFPGKIKAQCYPDWDVPSFDADKALYNTGASGEFWRNLLARSRNYPGRPMRVYRGFHGLAYADFMRVGPEYKLKIIEMGADGCTLIAESPLADLNKIKAPVTISDDNITTIDNAVTTIPVVDGSEYPDPTDYTRNRCYVKIDDEIIEYTGISGNDLTGCVRSALETSQVSHTAAKVSHVAFFGTDNGVNYANTPRHVTDVLQDLMEWAGIDPADVNTDSFDAIKDETWTEADTMKTVTKGVEIAKLMQELRETRGLIVFMDTDGKWACRALGPQSAVDAVLDEDSMLWRLTAVEEDEENRVTRVSFWYDPTEDSPGKDPEKYARQVLVISADLEQANNYGDVKQAAHYDAWVDPAIPVQSLRNIARRIITRLRRGERKVRFSLDIKDSALNVGDSASIQTRHVLRSDGTQDLIVCMIVERKERGAGMVDYTALDMNYGGRYFRIAPDTVATDYDSATVDDKQYGYWGDETTNRVGDIADPGYIWW